MAQFFQEVISLLEI